MYKILFGYIYIYIFIQLELYIESYCLFDFEGYIFLRGKKMLVIDYKLMINF